MAVNPNYKQAAKAPKYSGTVNKIFTDPENLQPAQITALLQGLGFPVSKDQQIAAETAQLIMAGGALATAIDAGDDIDSYIAPSIAMAQAGTALLETMGLLDPHSPLAETITLGADVAQVWATGGADVVADLKLAMDTYAAAQVPDAAKIAKAKAYGLAAETLNKYLTQRFSKEKDALSLNFSDYHNGKISTFGLMAKIAEESPDLFYNYYPQAKAFLPPDTLTITETATVGVTTKSYFGQILGGAVGGVDSSTQTMSVSKTLTTVGASKAWIQDNIFMEFIAPILDPYRIISGFQRFGFSSTMKFQTFAALSLLPPYVDYFPVKFDVIKFLSNYGLTFHDLNESQVIPGVVLNQLQPPSPPQSSYTLNGVDYVDPTQIATYKKQLANYNQSQIIFKNATQKHLNLLNFDSRGDIKSLLKNLDQDTYNEINRMAIPPWDGPQLSTWPLSFVPSTKTVVGNWTPDKMSESLRSIRNYWSALSLLETIEKDPSFSDISQRFSQYDYLGTKAKLEAQVKRLNFKMHCRGLNQMAMKNIASYLKTTPDKIVIKSRIQGKPTVFGVKG